MLCKSLIRHKLCHQQPLIALTAATYQIRQPLIPKLPHHSSLFLQSNQDPDHKSLKEQLPNHRNLPQIENYQELPRIRPSHAVEPLHSNLPIVVQHSSVDYVWGLLSVLRDDILGRESGRCSSKLLKAVLCEAW